MMYFHENDAFSMEIPLNQVKASLESSQLSREQRKEQLTVQRRIQGGRGGFKSGERELTMERGN